MTNALTTEPISVVLIDDHMLVAESIAIALSADEDIVIAAVAGTCAEGLKEVQLHQPTICLLDQRLPDGTGTDLLPALLQASPNTKILLVTASDSDDVLRRALDGGCVGFLAKGQRASALIDAVHRASEGELVLTPEDLRRLIPNSGNGPARLGGDLTPRERELLNMLVQGLNTPAIAEQLFLSRATVRNHIQSIITKLGAHSKLEAVTIALREGLVEQIQ